MYSKIPTRLPKEEKSEENAQVFKTQDFGGLFCFAFFYFLYSGQRLAKLWLN